MVNAIFCGQVILSEMGLTFHTLRRKQANSIYWAVAMNDNNCREQADPEKVMSIEIGRQTQFQFELDMLLSLYILNSYYILG